MNRRHFLAQPSGPELAIAGDIPDTLADISDDRFELIESPAVSPEPSAPPSGRVEGAVVQAAERQLVGALLADNVTHDAFGGIVRPEDFSDPAAGTAYRLALAILDGRLNGMEVADAITLSAHPEVARAVPLETLQGWVAAAKLDPDTLCNYARIVADAASDRRLHAAVHQARGIAGQDRPAQSRSEDIQRLMADAVDTSRKVGLKQLGDAAVEAITRIAEQAKTGASGVEISTGLRDLDAITAGMHPGNLIVVAARPGVGKTAFAMSIGLHTAKMGLHTVMASLEMAAEELSQRAIAQESGVNGHSIRIGALSEAEWDRVISATERLKELPFNVVDEDVVDLPALTTLCRRLHREGKLRVLIVDYIQIMDTSNSGRQTRQEQISDITRGLKKLAKRLGIPVIALSQLNRAVETRMSKRPVLADLRESGSIEQDSDVVIFLHREEVYDPSTTKKGLADVIIGKQRGGATGEFTARYDAPTTRYSDFGGYGAAALTVDPMPAGNGERPW